MREVTVADLRSIANQYGLSLSLPDLEGHRGWLNTVLAAFTAIDDMPDEFPALRYPGRNSSRPSPEENPLGAWWVKTRIDRAQTGKLHGRTIAIKDNVFIAGVPLMNGSSILEGYVSAPMQN